MKRLLIILLMFAPMVATAQDNDEELAAYFFSNQEYDKAAELYKKLHKKQPESNYIYSNYLVCLLELEDYDGAEKMLEKQIKRYPRKYIYQIDLAYVYEKAGNESKAEDAYQKPLKDLQASVDEIKNLANAYLRRNKRNLALDTYKKGRKLLRDKVIFAMEIADLYYELGQKEDMFNEYLGLLEYSQGYYQQVVSRLDIHVENDNDYETLKTQLLLMVQKHPNNQTFNEVLMWLFIRQKDFNSAFVQMKATDKRNKEGGRRLMQLAEICKQNDAYAMAAKCFDYVAEYGQENYYYLTARMGSLGIKYLILNKNYDYTPEDLTTLEAEYKKFVNEFGENTTTSVAIKQQAELYIKYMNKTDEAIALLKNVIDNIRVSKVFLAETKLLLGDAYLVQGNLWLARAQYSQVDYDFKEDELGEEARFRKAKVDYYNGDFVWAQSQLDILKSATTRFISNNAIDLSLLIQDNTGLDTTEDAMKMYARADLLIYQSRFDEAVAVLDSIPILFPTHSLTDEIYYAKAHIMVMQRNYDKAIEFYNKIITDFGEDILADNAMFELAELYEYRLKDKEKAKDLYEKIILDHPGSLFVVEARKRYRKLRGDTI